MATLKEQDIVLHTTDSSGNPVIQLPVTRLENVEGQDSKLVHTTGNETVAGTKTFSTSPIAPTPTVGDNSTKVATTAFVTTVGNAKAPTSHASSATTYGIGTGSNYGHVKLSDSTSSTSTTSSGVAATPKAVKAAYDLANTANTTANTKAADSAVVKLTGDQTIAGAKTFTETIHTNHSITNCKTVPSANEYQTALVLRDTQGQAFGHLQTASYADTESVLVKLSIIDGIRNGQTLDGAALTHAIGIGMDKDGNHFTHAPTPSAGDDSNQIATTKWVNDEAVHKASTETISGSKTFSAATTFSNTVNVNASVMGGAGRDLWFAHASGGTQHRTVLLSGNAYADGASLYLHAKDQANKGRFDLVAHDGTNSKILVGTPDGTLTWASKNVVRSVNGTEADASGDVTVATGLTASAYSANNYIKLSNGLQICMGSVTMGSSLRQTVTFPRAFSSAPKLTITRYGEENASATVASVLSATGFTAYGGSSTKFNYIAVGVGK